MAAGAHAGLDMIAAVKEGNLIRLQELIVNEKADVNGKDHAGKTSLIWASALGRMKAVRLLISHKAKPNITDNDNLTALMYACKMGHANIADFLLCKKANTETTCSWGKAAIHTAVANGHVSVVRCLLGHGSNVNVITSWGSSALYIACQYGYPEIAALLIEYGANPNYQGDRMRSRTPVFEPIFWYFICTRHQEFSQLVRQYRDTYRVLCNNNACLDLPDKHDITALEYIKGFNKDWEKRNIKGFLPLPVEPLKCLAVQCIHRHSIAYKSQAKGALKDFVKSHARQANLDKKSKNKRKIRDSLPKESSPTKPTKKLTKLLENNNGDTGKTMSETLQDASKAAESKESSVKKRKNGKESKRKRKEPKKKKDKVITKENSNLKVVLSNKKK